MNDMNNMNSDTNDMKDIKRSESSFKRKLKHGSVAIIFTSVFIAAIFILNIVATSVNRINPMFIDMTREQIFGITENSITLLEDIDKTIEIAFFMPEDLYAKSKYGRMIVNCIRVFAGEFDNIIVTEYDIIKEPWVRREFAASDLSRFATTSIGVRTFDEDGNPGRARLLSNSAFFVIAQSTNEPFAFNGERILTSTILQVVAQDDPLVLFTMGHGESRPSVLDNLFTQNGFRVENIDLSIDDIPEDATILVICNPQKDFIGSDPNNPMIRSEIDKVASFLNHFGSVMYFSDPEVSALPELDDLMKDYGMEFEHNTLVMDDSNSIYLNTNLSADYFVAGNVGDELHASIRRQPSPPRTIVPYAKPINILHNIASERTVSPVLTSFPTSYRVNDESGQSGQGVSNLLVIAHRTQNVGDQPRTSLFLVSGSFQFLAGLSEDSIANSDILLNAMRIMTNRRIAVDLRFKEFDSTALNMNLEDQRRWTLITILLLPSIVSVAGIIVWFRRRHS